MKNSENVPYFGEREEEAVIRYVLSDSSEEKNLLYNKILIEPFRKMIESILRRYPIFVGNYDMSEVESNALGHLIDNMIKYRPFIIEYKENNIDNKWIKMDINHRYMFICDANKRLCELIDIGDGNEYRIFNSRAFSYCQTIIRNYYKDHGKKTYLEKMMNLPFDDYSDDINENVNYSYEMEYESQHYLEKLIDSVILKIENKIDGEYTMKKNEIVVGDAIVNILKNWHLLFLEDSPEGKYNKKVTKKFQKNKILLFLKEQTGLSTKEIRIAIKPFKEIYFIEKAAQLKD